MSGGGSSATGLSRRNTLALGASGFLLGAGAHAQTPPRPPSSPRGQVVIGLSQEPTAFNPLMPGIEVDDGVHFCLFNALWSVDPKGELVPELAADVPTVDNGGLSRDGLTWKIRLREGVKWHDGTPFTAEDVKFTIELINTEGFRARTRLGHNLVRDIKIAGPHEITWQMQEAYSPYASILAGTFIVPRHILAAASDPNTSTFNNAPVGTGPFRWGERVAGDHLTLVANTDYFGSGPYLERATFKYIPDLNALYTQFRTGQIDVTSIQGILANFYEDARKVRGRTIYVNASSSIEGIAPNHGHPALSDKAVRTALYYGMNKQAIVDIIYYGLAKLTESIYPQESWAFNPDLEKHTYDPARANRILDEAGWKRGARGIREKNGVRLEFANSTTSGNPLREQVQQLLVQDWMKIGASMRINNMPAAVIWGDFFVMSKYESVLVGSVYQTGNDPDCAFRFASTAIPAQGGRGSNVYQFKNAELDGLFTRGSQTFVRSERKDIYQKAQTILRNDLAILPIFQYAAVRGTKEGLVGYRDNINNRTDCWNVGSWYWAT